MENGDQYKDSLLDCAHFVGVKRVRGLKVLHAAAI